jgi:hypothetical protein
MNQKIKEYLDKTLPEIPPPPGPWTDNDPRLLAWMDRMTARASTEAQLIRDPKFSSKFWNIPGLAERNSAINRWSWYVTIGLWFIYLAGVACVHGVLVGGFLMVNVMFAIALAMIFAYRIGAFITALSVLIIVWQLSVHGYLQSQEAKDLAAWKAVPLENERAETVRRFDEDVKASAQATIDYNKEQAEKAQNARDHLPECFSVINNLKAAVLYHQGNSTEAQKALDGMAEKYPDAMRMATEQLKYGTGRAEKEADWYYWLWVRYNASGER